MKILKMMRKASATVYEECKEELNLLQNWQNNYCDEKNEERVKTFCDFFIKVLSDEYVHYSNSKKKAWSKVRNALLFICTACGALLLIFAALLLEKRGTEILASVGVAGLTVIILAVILSYIYTRWQELKAHHETWVRHSVCYHRLRLALNRFLISQRDKEAYDQFEAQVFAIMEQNLDQFVLNMSGNGMATRTHSSKADG